MSYRDLWEIIKLVAVLCFCSYVVIFLLGCANPGQSFRMLEDATQREMCVGVWDANWKRCYTVRQAQARGLL